MLSKIELKVKNWFQKLEMKLYLWLSVRYVTVRRVLAAAVFRRSLNKALFSGQSRFTRKYSKKSFVSAA